MRLCITLYLRAWTLWTERRKSDRDAALCQRCGVNDYNQKRRIESYAESGRNPASAGNEITKSHILPEALLPIRVCGCFCSRTLIRSRAFFVSHMASTMIVTDMGYGTVNSRIP